MLKIDIKEKKFGDKIILKDVILEISQNGIYGFVGRNGEGKTTLFNCISGFLNFDGTVQNKQQTVKFSEIAFCPTEVFLYDELTPTEFNDFYKALLNLKTTATEMLFDVPKEELIKGFSTGMKKKTFLNALFQKKYSIYIFDEPFNGLDLESNYLLMNYIKQISKESIVLISSHILEILYKDCNIIYLIKNSKIKEFERENFSKIEGELFDNSHK